MDPEVGLTSSLLLQLPAELVHHILRYLPASSIGHIACTCRLLNEHALSDVVWKDILQDILPDIRIKAPAPGSSYRDAFLLHHPYWFIPKYKIWYSDTVHTGRLLIARYSQRRQTIEAYSLAAERGPPGMVEWTENPDVIIHTFEPEVKLDLNMPVLKLDAENAASLGLLDRFSSEMVLGTNSMSGLGGLNSRLMLARPMREDLIYPGMGLWPPQTLPALSRTRNVSSEQFRGTGHRPSNMSELSTHSFRIRRWMDFSSPNARMTARVGEEVATYSTLPPESYTPTPAKPWRGIWCGDYSGHGCEFLVLLQPDDPIELPSGAQEALLRSQQRRRSSTESMGSYQTAHTSESAIEDDDSGHTGQLLAVKLTGDPNIPRGEYSFISPDIGPQGTVRIATEKIFHGARVVKSLGHIAARGFRDGNVTH